MAHDIEKKWRSKDVLVLENVDFSSMLLCDRVLAGLAKAGFKKPSPIQLESIPTGRFGKDLLVQAKSGTGKTLVFVIVALEMLHRKMFRPQVLILVPTREIATQICSVIKSIGSFFPKLTCESFIGGFPVADDVKKAHNCQIVVGTPGRLKQLIQMKALSTNSIRLAVFDEADEVLSHSWLEDIDFIFNSLPEDKQVIATSATYPPKLKKVIMKYLRDPYLAQVDTKKLALLGIIHYIKIVESSAMPVKQYRFKLAALEPILKNIKFTQCLVYCNGIYKVETLYRDIKKWGFSTTFISSNRDQAERLRAIDSLKRFKCKVLVSSNVTARGIDAENVDLVINFDVSNYTETYLHRSGRAGRYGSKGATISLVDLFELKFIERIEKEARFKSYELPDPVPTDLIQNPVLDKYTIEISTILENEVEERSPSTNNCLSESCSEQCGNQLDNLSVITTDGNDQVLEVVNGISVVDHVEPYSLSESYSEQCGNQLDNLSVITTDGNDQVLEVVNGVSVDHVEPYSLLKKSAENSILNDEESKNNLKNHEVNNERDNNSNCLRTVNNSIPKKSEDSEGNYYITIKNGNTVVSNSENAESTYKSINTISSVIVNEYFDNENVKSLTNGENCIFGTNANSSISVKESSPKCEISEDVNVKNTEGNVVLGSENLRDLDVTEPSISSVREEIVEEISKRDNPNCHSSISGITCAEDTENKLVNSNKKFCDVNDEKSSISSTNELDMEVSTQQNCLSKLQTTAVLSSKDFDKNAIKTAVENYVKNFENLEKTVFNDRNNSLEFKCSTAENSVNKKLSLDHIRDFNSRRRDYYYEVFKLFQECKSSKDGEREKEAIKKENSSINKVNSFQEPMPFSESSSVEIHPTPVFSNELSLENVTEFKFEKSHQISDVPAQEEPNEVEADIQNFHQSPCHKSTPHSEKNKPIVTHLMDKGVSEPPERSIMSFFEEVSAESNSDTESYHETIHSFMISDPASCSSSSSESDSNSCTDSSSSSQSISSSADDDSCDQNSTVTSSSESQLSGESLSVHSIEYSSRKDMKSFVKHSHSTVFKQDKIISPKKHQQICRSECTDKRQQYHSKTYQTSNHSNHNFYNVHQHAQGANYSNACSKPSQFTYSKDHQASSNGKHFRCKKFENMHKNKNNFVQFSCNGQHSPACFIPSEHRCHPYNDSTPCNQRAICDQWYQIFCYQQQHIQNCSSIHF